MQTLLNVLVFLLILTGIIVIHELGHFVAAKFFKVYCGAFSIGMGPKIYGKKGKETEFQIRALPIGGFVSMAGEADQEDNEEFKDVPVERTLKGKKTYQKIIIMLAGVFMNFMLALVIMLSANLMGGQVNVNRCEVGTLVENGSATKYGFKKGDIVTNIECKQTGVSYAVASYEDLHSDMTKKALKIDSRNATLDITVRRGKDSIVIKSTAIFNALGQLIVNFASTIKQMSGPVGIYKVTSQVRESGSMTTLLYLVAMLSVNIGIFNLLPIPGLDGYQAILSLIEGIIHREVPVKVKYALQVLGLALVFGLMIAVTYQDLLRLFK